MNKSEEHEHQLPGEGTYFTVFLVLALLTLVELLVTYIPVIKIPLLLALAATKAWLVVQFYMHLRYDSKVFTWALLIPVGIGLLIMIIIQPLATIVR
ncbi:MAG: cytochrome C oxidase subunit IV family protein [Chloroflexota bacterium]